MQGGKWQKKLKIKLLYYATEIERNVNDMQIF